MKDNLEIVTLNEIKLIEFFYIWDQEKKVLFFLYLRSEGVT